MSVLSLFPSTNITISDVADTLNAGGGTVSSVMSSAFRPEAKINAFSRWKPIFSDITSMTSAELRANGYGINIRVVNGWTNLQGAVLEDGLGYDYHYNDVLKIPLHPIRLGDFRNYYAVAPNPASRTFREGQLVVVGRNIDEEYPYTLMGFELRPPEGVTSKESLPYICFDELYPPELYPEGLPRAAVCIQKDRRYFYVGTIPFGERGGRPDKGGAVGWLLDEGEVTIIECYYDEVSRNCYPLPLPVCTINLERRNIPDKKIATALVHAIWSTSDVGTINYKVVISAVAEECTGGNLSEVVLSIRRDRDNPNSNVTGRTLGTNVNIPKGEYRTFEGNLTCPQYPLLYVCVTYDGKLQASSNVLSVNPVPLVL